MAQVMVVSGAQLKAARELLRATQREVAELLGVHEDTIRRAEHDHPGSRRTRQQLVGMLMRNGVVFENGGVVRRQIGAPR